MTKGKDLLNLIESRRSVRTYTDETVPEGGIRNILNAGRWAPTPSNVQSWRFGVVKEEGTLSNLKNISPGFPDSATLGFVICSNEEDLGSFSGEELSFLRASESAMAVQNMLLAAWDQGIGTSPVASFSRKGVAELLDLPDQIVPVLLIAAGYPKAVPDPPAREDLKSITFREEYDSSL